MICKGSYSYKVLSIVNYLIKISTIQFVIFPQDGANTFHFPLKHVFYMIIFTVNNFIIVYDHIIPLTFQSTIVLLMLSSLQATYTNNVALIFQMMKSNPRSHSWLVTGFLMLALCSFPRSHCLITDNIVKISRSQAETEAKIKQWILSSIKTDTNCPWAHILNR